MVLSFEDARRIVEAHAAGLRATQVETVELIRSSGRILAEPVYADRDIPPFARSTRDGYAVRSADLATIPGRLSLRGEIKAGEAAKDVPCFVHSGEAYSIMTGAPVPAGSDSVVMVEYTSVRDDSLEVLRRTMPGENVVAQGAEAASGSLLLPAGTRLNESAIALAASVGKSQLNVFRRPRVAVLTTGDELVPLDGAVGPGQIRNSNSYSLAVQVQQAGGEPVLLPIAPDEPLRLRELTEEGLKTDLLLMTGGVSMGRYDLVEQVLSELNAEFFFTGAKIQPGKPVVFGRVPSTVESGDSPEYTYCFGLPGNPVSTMVTFELFARPVIEALAGMTAAPLQFLHARLKSEIRVKLGIKRFLPAILSGHYENCEVQVVSWQGSGDIAARSRSNCYLVIPENRELIAAAEWVAVMLR